MKQEIVQGLLYKVASELFSEDELTENSAFFSTMAKFKYDGYKQFAPGMRFIERFALWLAQIENIEDRRVAYKLVKEKLVYISSPELDLLVSSCYPDIIKPILISKVAEDLGIPSYKVSDVLAHVNFKSIQRQSLFCGLSDGARTEIFRRANNNSLSHEQIYQTYELSGKRAIKMKRELAEDQTKILGRSAVGDESKFKMLFLLDDFSASGTSYLKYNSQTNELKGKIYALYDSIYSQSDFSDIFDLDNLEVNVVLYMCTTQAKDNIEANFERLRQKFKLMKSPKLHIVYLIPDSTKVVDGQILELCEKGDYYDTSNLEDKHTGSVRLGFSDCALPIVLYHNCPNNSLSILWAYEDSSFQGLFPRVPRHREL